MRFRSIQSSTFILVPLSIAIFKEKESKMNEKSSMSVVQTFAGHCKQ